MKKIKWEIIKPQGNYVLHFRGGYISYNPDTAYSAMVTPDYGFLERIGNTMGCLSGEETALYLNKDDKYRILTGDFRKEYEKCKTIKKKLAVYKKNIKKRNPWSTD